jgi:hypothetical protein
MATVKKSVYLDQEVYDEIRRLAQAESRSVTAQIAVLLTNALGQHQGNSRMPFVGGKRTYESDAKVKSPRSRSKARHA